jgi:hypothetical protein
MKFILGAAGLEPAKEANGIMEKFNNFSDYVVGKEVELILAPIGGFLKECAIAAWQWFLINLPDILGYTTIGAGILIILSAMAGKGVVKPLAWYFGAFIIAACILGSV